KNPTATNAFCEADESFKAYNIARHRHTSEIEQELSLAAGEEVMVSFTPHLLPIKRGILSTIYATPKAGVTAEHIQQCYLDAYAGQPFIRIKPIGQTPEIKHVAGSNMLDIGFVLDSRVGRLVVVSALDNLIKGAAGQAVQNMNLRFGLEQTTGLLFPAMYL
nr:Asd/ArgC dimerization domain-containing protein [bacterium]